MIYHRYVAIGDSTTEGMDDPDGDGGYRGWADRFAVHVARSQLGQGGLRPPGVEDGLANGYLNKSTITTTAGLRFRF